ncbi:MAG: sulfatase-like hydrolase/transferase [Luteitalea sp.]|nr:sulfatase-like hydrolase/transferase [Luteitalea sp.]
MACLLVVAALAEDAEPETSPPNFLWITVEDMSARLGSYGDSTVPTPHIDRLAREGVRFTRAFATYGVCAPSRHSLITGMYPTSTGAMHMRTMQRTAALDEITDPELLAIPTYEATPAPEVKTFTEYLRAAGYYTTNNAKTDYQFQNPVTAWDESSEQADWRHRPSKAMPFFAVFNSGQTHQSRIFEPSAPPVVDRAEVPLPPYYPDRPLVRRDVARHYDNIAAMDQWVGDILKRLEEDGLMEETIIFFFSDHGDGLPRAKRWVTDSGIHVPLIVRFPQREHAGTVNDDLVSFVDFAPTMLSLAGLEIPDYMQGHVFFGPKQAAPRRYVYAFRDRNDPAPERIRAVRDKRFKYIRNYRPDLPYIGFIPYDHRAEGMQDILRLTREQALGAEQWQLWAQHKPLEELYDTDADPHEIQNLAADPRYVDKLAELRQAHDAWRRKYGDLGDLSETDLIKRLWPPDGKQPTTADPEVQVQGETVIITSATEGASIAYRLGGGRWLLYTKPLVIDAPATVEMQAVRLGWKASRVVSQEIGRIK